MEGCSLIRVTAVAVVAALLYSAVAAVSLGEKTFNVVNPGLGFGFGDGQTGQSHVQKHHSQQPHSKCNLNSTFTRRCGIKPLINPKFYTKEESAYGEFPHHVAIIRSGDMKFLCSGALIDDIHVITAARCIADIPEHQIIIRLGEWDILNDKNLQEVYFSIERTCAKAFIHPQYLAGQMDHHGLDVAILRMDHHIDFDVAPSVSPICLPDHSGFDRTNSFSDGHGDSKTECYVAGWSESPVLVLEAEYYRHFMIDEDLDGDKRRKRAAAATMTTDMLSDEPDADYDAEEFTDIDIDAVNAAASGKPGGIRRAAQAVIDAAVADIYDDDFGYFDDDFGMCDVDLDDIFLQNALRGTGIKFPPSTAAVRNALRRQFRRRLQKRSLKDQSTDGVAKRELFDYSRILNKAKVQVLDLNVCRSAHGTEGFQIDDHMMCLTAKMDTNMCKADIGSPVVCISKEKIHTRHARDVLYPTPGHDFNAAPLKEKRGPVKKMFIAGVVSHTSCGPSSTNLQPAVTATSVNSVLEFICEVLSSH